MDHIEIKENIGKYVIITGYRDLAFNGGLRKYIHDADYKLPLILEKLSKGGLAVVKVEKTGQLLSVPPRNIELKTDYPNGK